MPDILLCIKRNRYLQYNKVMNVSLLNAVKNDFMRWGGFVDNTFVTYSALDKVIYGYLRPCDRRGEIRKGINGLYKSIKARGYGAKNITGFWDVTQYINDQNITLETKRDALADFADIGGVIKIGDDYIYNAGDMYVWYLNH